VLLCFDSIAAENSVPEAAAINAHVPLQRITIRDPDAAQLYERGFVLVRPDGHVAWQADNMPADAGSVIEAVRGAAARYPGDQESGLGHRLPCRVRQYHGCCTLEAADSLHRASRRTRARPDLSAPAPHFG
jgi:hypothetical protein